MKKENQVKNRLAEVRKERGLSQAEVGEELGVTYASVSRHENSNRGLTLELVEKYCKLYGCEAHELFFTQEDFEEEVSD